MDCCDKALEIDPTLAQAWHEKGDNLLHINFKSREALDCFSKVLEIDPDNERARLLKYMCMAAVYGTEKAIDWLEKH